MTSANDWAFYERHFAPARLRHYLTSTGGDQRRAMLLYRWNVSVSAAFWESLAYFEVAFRNSVTAQLEIRHSAKGRTGHWVFDDARELGRDADGPNAHRRPYTDIAEAIRRVQRNRRQLDPGQIISEISFGFWHQMVSSRQLFLWPDLAGAFPNAPDRNQVTVQKPIRRLRDIRNRIGHHHRIWSQDIEGAYKDLTIVAGFIDPDLAVFISERSSVPRLLELRPE